MTSINRPIEILAKDTPVEARAHEGLALAGRVGTVVLLILGWAQGVLILVPIEVLAGRPAVPLVNL